MNTLRRWTKLKGAERLGLPMMMLALPAISVSLSLFGYQRTQRLIERFSAVASRRDADADDLEAAKRLVWLAGVAGRHGPVEATCLRQSLLVYGLLRQRSLDPILHLGMRRRHDVLNAHAWVELAKVKLDGGAEEFTPF